MAQIEIREFREKRRGSAPAKFRFLVVVNDPRNRKEAVLHDYEPVSKVRDDVFNEATWYATNAATVLGISVFHLTWNMTQDGPKLTGSRRRIYRAAA